MHRRVMELLAAAEGGEVASEYTAPGRLARLLDTLHRQAGQPVAVLVDEYDKPILEALDVPAVARANRDYLRGLYGVIKSSDADVRFTLVTGVSKFSKVSLFSDLNNLTDITLDPVYSAICGYTEGDLDTVFGAELEGLDRARVREWYNGYSWLGEGIQPVRCPAATTPPQVRRPLVRDWDARGPGGNVVPAPGRLGFAERAVGHRGVAVRIRRGSHRHGGAAVPDRLPDDPLGTGPGRRAGVSTGLSESRNPTEPEP